jgi:hypothetical protein
VGLLSYQSEDTQMQRLTKLFLLMLTTMVWAGTASALSIDLTVINPGHIPSATIYGPSDIVTVEVSMDSEGLGVYGYFFHLQWSQSLSFSGFDPGSQWLPNFPAPIAGFTDYWRHFPSNLVVDAYGLQLNGYTSLGSMTQVFYDDVLSTLMFHVVAAGDGSAVISPFFAPADGVYDQSYQPIPGVILNSVMLSVPEPATVLLVGLGILGVAYTRAVGRPSGRA